jgi:hypothetical protein
MKGSFDLRPDNCQLYEYEAWYESEFEKLNLAPGFMHIGPFVNALGAPDSPPWDSDFAIIYPDGMYVRVLEYYRPLPRLKGGGGCLERFSYHYGPTSKGRDEDGFPLFSSEFDLRIDLHPVYKLHAHYMKEDHIPEARLSGLDSNKLDPFVFVAAVETRRRTQRPLPEILGFKVEPSK